MAKKGRPTDTSKSRNRVHQIVLTEKAEILFRELEYKMPAKWFHHWVSVKLIETFGKDNEKELLIARKKKLLTEAADLTIKLKEIDNRLKEINAKE